MLICVIAVSGCPVGPVRAADESDAMLERMKTLSEKTVVQVRTKDGLKKATLIPAPVFRYDDQPRRITDASLWAWVYDGRLVALQKVEAFDLTEVPQWTYCFASFAREPLDVTWPNGKRLQFQAPGVAMQVLPEAPRAAGREFIRAQQMKKLSQRFSATITTVGDGSQMQEMRLLPKPVFVYPAKPAAPTVALYGLTTNGTNPDAYVVVQVDSGGDREAFDYGLRRMTLNGVRIRLDGRRVWETKEVTWPRQPDAKEAWTFFYTPREPDSAGKETGKPNQ